jgi:catechol 2,3-dioxygenase-like lactoylglutathione lyase family enzyme
MPLLDMHHVAIKNRDLEATERFYVDVLGMRKVARPDFDFPGAWLQMGTTMFHLMGGDMAVNPKGEFEEGSAAVDHIALQARDFDSMKARLLAHNLEYTENEIREFGIWQLFVSDPNGVRIELNFDARQEPAGAKGPASQRAA